jgi:hypothetical protein
MGIRNWIYKKVKYFLNFFNSSSRRRKVNGEWERGREGKGGVG